MLNDTENKSYRIRNSEDQLASVWQIGSGEFFAVKFDEDDEPLIYTHGDVSNAFRNGWIIVGDEPVKEESLPRMFKFKVQPDYCDKTVYTYDGEAKSYYDPKTDTWYHMKRDYMENAIVQGLYIVLPSEPTENNISWEEYWAKDDNQDIIRRIKSATQNYDMTISVDSGTYHIYDNLCDVSYKADTDEKLIEILDCIDYLSECVA